MDLVGRVIARNGRTTEGVWMWLDSGRGDFGVKSLPVGRRRIHLGGHEHQDSVKGASDPSKIQNRRGIYSPDICQA